jgi:crotonobetainyl-CoA:carnitine CoA-transferase CaiB-like acyl-CoA transferase
MQAYRPGTLAKRGLSPSDVAALRPGIVYTTLSAWGHEGPWQDRRGFDTVVQAASGFGYRPDNAEPILLPVSALDYIAGYLMAYGTMLALHRRAKEGGSWFVRTSLAGVRHWVRNHGLNEAEDIDGLAPELPQDQVKSFMMESPSLIGTLCHLRPAIQMSETKAGFSRPSVPHGYNKPIWPASVNDSGIKA